MGHQRAAIHVSADDSGRGRSDIDDDDVCKDAGPDDEGDRHEDLDPFVEAVRVEEGDVGPFVEDPRGGERRGVEKIKYRLRDVSALPTRKIHAALKAATGRRVAMSAALYAASATEYLVSEVCELAGDRR